MKTFKVLFFTICFTFLFFINSSKAQLDVTINPIALLFGNFDVAADYVLSEKLSVEGAIGLQFGNSNLLDDEFKYFGIPITVFGKYYFNPNRGADKFYVDAWVRLVSRNYSYESANNSSFFSDYTQTRLGIGFGIGYKVVSSGNFVFDIGLGGGRALLDKTKYQDSSGNNESVDWPGIMFVGKLAVGYRFGGG